MAFEMSKLSDCNTNFSKAPSSRMSRITLISVFGFVASSLSLSGIPVLSRVNDFIALALLVQCLLFISKRGWVVSKWIMCCLPFIFISFVMSIRNEISGIQTFISILPMWIGSLCMASLLRDRSGENAVLSAFIFAASANSIAVIVGFDSFAVHNPLAEFVSGHDLLNRSSGLVGNANVYSMQAAFALLLVYVFRPNMNRVIMLLVWSLAIHSVITSGSRKGLGLVLLVVAYHFTIRITESKLSKNKVISLTSGIALFVLVMFWAEDIFNAANLHEFTAINRAILAIYGEDTSFSERNSLISEATTIFLNSPVWGYGLDSFRHISSFAVYAHNNTLEIAVSGGIILAISYYSIYYAAFKRLYATFARSEFKLRAFLLIAAIIFVDVSSVTYNLEVIPIVIAMMATFRDPVDQKLNIT